MVADRHRDAGCERPFEHGVLPSSRLPAASMNALRVKRGGPGQGRASGERSERSLDAAERFHRIRMSKRRVVLHWRDWTGFHESRLAEAVVPMRVTDDQVIEQRQVEDVGRGAQPQRQSRIVRTGCRITARMVVHDHQAGRARCETRRHEDIRHGHRRAGPCAARHHVPGEQAVLRRETRHGEDLDGLIGDQWRENRGRGTRVFQHHSRDVDDAPIAVTQRAIGADEFPHAVTACGC